MKLEDQAKQLAAATGETVVLGVGANLHIFVSVGDIEIEGSSFADALDSAIFLVKETKHRQLSYAETKAKEAKDILEALEDI